MYVLLCLSVSLSLSLSVCLSVCLSVSVSVSVCLSVSLSLSLSLSLFFPPSTPLSLPLSPLFLSLSSLARSVFVFLIFPPPSELQEIRVRSAKSHLISIDHYQHVCTGRDEVRTTVEEEQKQWNSWDDIYVGADIITRLDTILTWQI